MNEKELLEESRGLGYDGESVVEVEKLCEKHRVSDELRKRMMEEFEEGYFDW